MDYSPGPWRVGTNVHNDGGISIMTTDVDAAGFGRVAVVDEYETVEGAANARLIAAAPDLLDAALDLSVRYRDEEEGDARVIPPHGCNLHDLEALRDAILKATVA